MVIKIKDKEYPITIGLGAINYLDKIYFVESDGVKLGEGISYLIYYLTQQNPTALYNFYKAGITTLKQKPSNEDLEGYVEDLFKTEKSITKAFEEAMEELKKSLLIKIKTATILKTMKMAENGTL